MQTIRIEFSKAEPEDETEETQAGDGAQAKKKAASPTISAHIDTGS